MHPYHHSLSSVRKHGGKVEDYINIHSWFDQSKSGFADFRHRAMLHHSEGIFMAERAFGIVITNSDLKQVPVRVLGEQHVKEDLGFIPSMKDWFKKIEAEPWMMLTPRSLPESGQIIIHPKQAFEKYVKEDKEGNQFVKRYVCKTCGQLFTNRHVLAGHSRKHMKRRKSK